MKLFNKLKQWDARRAAEEAENKALCERYCNSPAIKRYAVMTQEMLFDVDDPNVTWASKTSTEKKKRFISLFIYRDGFGIAAAYQHDVVERYSDGTTFNHTIFDYDIIDLQELSNYGLAPFPNMQVMDAVLETFVGGARSVDYLTITRAQLPKTLEGGRASYLESLNIWVNPIRLHGARCRQRPDR